MLLHVVVVTNAWYYDAFLAVFMFCGFHAEDTSAAREPESVRHGPVNLSVCREQSYFSRSGLAGAGVCRTARPHILDFGDLLFGQQTTVENI